MLQCMGLQRVRRDLATEQHHNVPECGYIQAGPCGGGGIPAGYENIHRLMMFSGRGMRSDAHKYKNLFRAAKWGLINPCGSSGFPVIETNRKKASTRTHAEEGFLERCRSGEHFQEDSDDISVHH